MNLRRPVTALFLLLFGSGQASAQESTWISLGDAGELKGTFWIPENPTRAALFIHGCTSDESEFRDLPALFSSSGHAVLTYDLFAHGNSKTERIEIVSKETHDAVLGRVSNDAMTALQHLSDRAGESLPLTLIMSGCVAAWATDFILTSQTLDRIVLFSGPLREEAIITRPEIAVLAFLAEDDLPRIREALQVSPNASQAPSSEFGPGPDRRTRGAGALGGSPHRNRGQNRCMAPPVRRESLAEAWART